MDSQAIQAIIAVHFRVSAQTGERETYYVRRSETMKNYPGVLSLPSVQYAPGELPDPQDLSAVARIFERMSCERFKGTPLTVHRHLVSGRSDENPMQRMVELALYQVSFAWDPELNPDFYTESAWLTRPDFEFRIVLDPLPCGLCTRLWRQCEREQSADFFTNRP